MADELQEEDEDSNIFYDARSEVLIGDIEADCDEDGGRNEEASVGQTSSLHYYYLAFVVLTYLAYCISVSTSYRSSLGTTDLGIQALIA